MWESTGITMYKIHLRKIVLTEVFRYKNSVVNQLQWVDSEIYSNSNGFTVVIIKKRANLSIQSTINSEKATTVTTPVLT